MLDNNFTKGFGKISLKEEISSNIQDVLVLSFNSLVLLRSFHISSLVNNLFT